MFILGFGKFLLENRLLKFVGLQVSDPDQSYGSKKLLQDPDQSYSMLLQDPHHCCSSVLGTCLTTEFLYDM